MPELLRKLRLCLYMIGIRSSLRMENPDTYLLA
jgi:hypothetical protein